MECKCNLLQQCEADKRKIAQAKLKMMNASIYRETIRHYIGRCIEGLEAAYESEKKYRISENINAQKRIVDLRYDNINWRIQNESQELEAKMNCLRREDEQYHAEEARKREEEKRKK